MSLGLDTLIERGVIANERAATALEGLLRLAQEQASSKAEVHVGMPESRDPKFLGAAAEAGADTGKKRGRKPAAEKQNVDASNPNAVTATSVAPAPKQTSFLDEDEPAVAEAAPAVVELTPKEKYDKIRAGLIQTQNAQGPDAAFKILKDVGGVDMLRDLKVENYDKVLAALAAAQVKK